MTRPQPEPPPALAPRTGGASKTQIRRYRLLTPLFGGGVDQASTDPVTVIRGASVRGQLRFWWRACRGSRYGGDLVKMREAESVLWGAASTPKTPRPSCVETVVDVTESGHTFAPDLGVDRTRRKITPIDPESDYGYVTFPLREDGQDGRSRSPGDALDAGVEFTLTVTLRCRANDNNDNAEALWEDVQAALWAWETFGGIGARTRRGFGALHCVEIDGTPVPAPRPDEAERQVRAGLEVHVRPGKWPAGVPHLTPATSLKIVAAPPGNAQDGEFKAYLAAWRTLIKGLKDFRQYRLDAEGRRSWSSFGDSAWPEPKAIRRRTGKGSAKQRERLKESPPLDAFPRAVFGLPIVFKFKGDSTDRVPMDEPDQTTLQGKDHDRLASPLILRPLACRDNQAVGLALLLSGLRVPPGGLTLIDESKRVLQGSAGDPTPNITVAQAREIESLRRWANTPGRSPQDQASVLLAFLDSLGRTASTRKGR